MILHCYYGVEWVLCVKLYFGVFGQFSDNDSLQMTSNSEDLLPEVRKIERKDGEVTFSNLSVDGVGMIPFPGLQLNGPAEHFCAIRNLKMNKNDILLATFPKSGTCRSVYFIMSLLDLRS